MTGRRVPRALFAASNEQKTPCQGLFRLSDDDNGPGARIKTTATGSHPLCLGGHAEPRAISGGRRKAKLCLHF